MRRFSPLACPALLAVCLIIIGNSAGAQSSHHHHHAARPNYNYQRSVQFGGRSHLDALSADLKYRANAICWEMYRNYRTNPGYRETYREAYKMLQDAKHIYRLVYEDEYHRHHHGQGDRIAAYLADIDSLFHHIEDDIARWRPDHVNPHHPGSELHRLTDQFKQTLEHLMEDYGVRSQIPAQQDPPAPS